MSPFGAGGSGRLMVAVGMVALGLGIWQTIKHRREESQRLARLHVNQMRLVGTYGSGWVHRNETCRAFQEEGYSSTEDGNHWHSLAGLPRRVVQDWNEYHGKMAAKYEAAARSPWLPVAADPPPPPMPPPDSSDCLNPDMSQSAVLPTPASKTTR